MPIPTETTYVEARIIIRDHVCSKCWGGLDYDRKKENPSICLVRCGNPDCKGEGFVTKDYVARRKDEDFANFYTAKKNLSKILELPTNPIRSVEENLKALGF